MAFTLRLLPLALQGLLVTPAAAQQRDDLRELADRIAPFVRPLLEGRVCVGMAVGIHRGGGSAVRGFGRVDKAAERPPDGDTVYEIGSISKVFTGILLADAVQRRIVALEDPLQKHLPEGVRAPVYTNPDGADLRITLGHLTSHASALPRMPVDLRGGDPANPYAHYDAGRLYAGLSRITLTRAPGSRYEYSNLAAGLLGQVLADAQGQPDYESLLRARICDPLGLLDTRVALTPAMRRRFAPPYDAAQRRRHNWDLAALAGAGAIRSTINDLMRFAAFNLGAPLPAAARHLGPAFERARRPVFEPRRTKGPPTQPTVGCGWHIRGDGHTVWHNGATGGYRSFLALDTRAGLAVCVLANTTSRLVDQVAGQILDLARGKTVQPLRLRPALTVEEAILRRYVGTYTGASGARFEVTLGDGVLQIRLDQQPAHPVFAASKTRFFYRAVRAEVEFEVEGGAVRSLTLSQNGVTTKAERRG